MITTSISIIKYITIKYIYWNLFFSQIYSHTPILFTIIFTFIYIHRLNINTRGNNAIFNFTNVFFISIQSIYSTMKIIFIYLFFHSVIQCHRILTTRRAPQTLLYEKMPMLHSHVKPQEVLHPVFDGKGTTMKKLSSTKLLKVFNRHKYIKYMKFKYSIK